jgi:hypothetical protein
MANIKEKVIIKEVQVAQPVKNKYTKKVDPSITKVAKKLVVSKLTRQQTALIKIIDPEQYDLELALEQVGADVVDFEQWIKSSHFAAKFFEAVGINFKQYSFLKVFESKGCNISLTCKAIGCTRRTYDYWLANNPLFKTMVRDCQEAQLDLAESFLQKKIQEGDVASTIFFLKTKGRHRGYVEKIETENLNRNIDARDISNLPDEDLDSLIDQLQKRYDTR